MNLLAIVGFFTVFPFGFAVFGWGVAVAYLSICTRKYTFALISVPPVWIGFEIMKFALVHVLPAFRAIIGG